MRRRYRHFGLPVHLIFLLVLAHCEEIAAPEKHLIPQGYRGHVFILYSEPHGGLPLQERFSKVYRIPPSGILSLRVGPDENNGWTVRRYFFVGQDGKRRKITGYWASTIHRTKENMTDPEVGVFFPNSGTLNILEPPCSLSYSSYFIGTKRQVLEMTNDGVGDLESYARRNHLCLPLDPATERVMRNSGTGASGPL